MRTAILKGYYALYLLACTESLATLHANPEPGAARTCTASEEPKRKEDTSRDEERRPPPRDAGPLNRGKNDLVRAPPRPNTGTTAV